MKHLTFLVAAAALLGGTTFSQGGVADDSYWTDGDGLIVHVDVVDVDPNSPGCTVQMTTDTGSTSAVTGTASANSTTDKPKAESAPASATPGGTELDIKKKPGGTESRVRVKKNGKWTYLRKTKKPRVTQPQQFGSLWVGPGDEGTSLPPESL